MGLSRILGALAAGTLLSLASACGDDESDSGGSAGGGAAGSGAATGGGGASSGGQGGGGSGGIDCSRVGCAPPPMCDTGCTAACGCCSCGGNEQIAVDGGFLSCVGGCYAFSDAGAGDAQAD